MIKVNDENCLQNIERWQNEGEHRRALLIFNPIAGERRSMRLLPNVIRHMTNNGYACLSLTTTGTGVATDYTVKYGAGNEILICSGGDGTVNEVIRGMLQIPKEARPRLGYLPSGSTNDFATAVGIPKRTGDAILNLTSGRIRPVDIGCFNNRHYAYVAAFGAFTEVAYSTSQSAKNAFGGLAYLATGLDKVKNIRPIHARFVINGEQIEDKFIFCAISNSKIIAGILRLKPEWVDINDGEFEVMLIRYPTNAIELGKIVNAITTGEFRCEYIRMYRAKELTVTCLDDEPISWTLDGECEKDVREARILNVHSAISMMLPD